MNTDVDMWELSKENVQPLKQGRQIANLSAALNSNSSDVKLHEEKQQFENEIRTYNGDDPLEVWYSYICWTEQNFPRGGRDGKLLGLLETVVHKFKAIEMYKNDKRYVDAWLKLSSMLDDPLAMYQVMWDLGYGAMIAAFYQTWSWTVEQLGNYKKADTIYQYGIERRAEPLEWLKRQHSEFQARVVKRTAGEYVDPGQGVPTMMQQEPQRIHLGQLRGTGKNKTVGSNRVQATAHSSRSGFGPQPLPQQQLPTANARSNGIQIFCDENTAASTSMPPQTGEWQSLPKRSTFNTENEKKAGVWTKAKMKQKNVPNVDFNEVSQVSRPNFSVHEDDEQVPPATPKHSQLQFNASVLSDRKPSKSQNIVQKFQDPVPVDPSNVRVMYRKDQVYQGVEEFQLEELRAARYLADKKEAEQKRLIEELKSKNDQLEEERRRFQTEREEMLQKMMIEKEKFQQAMQKMSVKENESQLHTSQNPDNSQRNHSISGTSSSKIMPVNTTKVPAITYQIGAASNHLYNVSNVSSSSGRCNESNSSVQETTSSLLKTPNLSTGSGKTPDSKGILKKSLIMPSPTVNTKEAMQAVLGMFNNTLDVQAHLGFGPAMDDDEEPMETNFLSMGARPKTSFYGSNHESSTGGLMIYEDPETAKPCSNMMIYEDPCEKKPNSVIVSENSLHSHKPKSDELMIYEDPKIEYEKNSQFEDQENRAPVGYHQQKKRQGLSGILQPSTGIATGAPEQTEKNFVNDDLDGIFPLPDGDFTFAPTGASTSRFNVPTHMISTPFHPSENVPLPDAGVSKIHRRPFGEVNNTLMEQENRYHSDEEMEKENGHGHFRIPEDVPMAPRTVGRNRCSVGLALLSPISEASEKSSSSNEASSNRLGLTTTHHHSTMHTHMKTPHLSVNHSEHASSMNVRDDVQRSKPSTNERQLGVSLICSDPDELKLPMMPCVEAFNQTCHEVDISAYTPPDFDDKERKMMSESIMINPKNPFDSSLIANFLANLDEPLNEYSSYIECIGPLPQIILRDALILGDDTYMVDKKIGEGAFGKVYKAMTFDDLSMSDPNGMCLKIQKPACPWEYYISCELQKRLVKADLQDLCKAFVSINSGYFYDNGSCLVTPFHPNGNILNLVNACNKLPQWIMVYFTVELLRIAEALIACDIIHGDIKPDNVLLVQLPVPVDGKQYSTVGEVMKDQTTNCLQLIDYGCSIDMTLFPPSTTFTARREIADLNCIEMQTERPWTWQTDLFGIAGIVHTLLFGTYMKVYQGPNKRWKVNSKCKRWCDETLWNHLFDVLLNIPSCDQLPDLAALIAKFESFPFTLSNDLFKVESSLYAYLNQ